MTTAIAWLAPVCALVGILVAAYLGSWVPSSMALRAVLPDPTIPDIPRNDKPCIFPLLRLYCFAVRKARRAAQNRRAAVNAPHPQGRAQKFNWYLLTKPGSRVKL